MKYSKIFNIISPLTILAGLALLASICGGMDSSKGNEGGGYGYSDILYLVGLPVLIISLLLHFAFNRLLKKQNHKIWTAETILIVISLLIIYHR